MNNRNISKYLNLFKALLLVSTIGVLAIHPHLPEKTINLFPNTYNAWGYYADGLMGGNSTVAPINTLGNHWRCLIGDKSQHKLCGGVINFYNTPEQAIEAVSTEQQRRASTPAKTLNLSSYKGIWVTLKYKGKAENIRFSLTNYEPQISSKNKDRDSRFMYTHAYTQELNAPTFLAFNEFNVADWWVKRFRIHRKDTVPRFDKVRGFFIEVTANLPNTEHLLVIESVVAVGDFISSERLYQIILFIWIICLCSEGIWRIHHLYSHQKNMQSSLDALKNHYKTLQDVAYKDELTGLFNRHAINNIIDATFNRGAAANLAILIIDVDHFKAINDTYGHVVGDEILQHLAQVLTNNTRKVDNLGRWGGEEFIIITEQPSAKNTLLFADKIRAKVATSPIRLPKHPELKINITISIGLTLTLARENFDQAFERADQALYQAKTQGRNRCCGL